MPLKIHNSLTKSSEHFEPNTPGVVRMYVCGPTVYDDPHVGHLRSAYTFEVIRSYLESSGFQVQFVRNVTDVDDKIIEKAKTLSVEGKTVSAADVSSQYLDRYRNALERLKIRPPTHEPAATAHVDDMIVLIERLIAQECAYESGGDVYFNVNGFHDYGKLSHQKKDQMLEGVRSDPNEKKRDPLDFALWKKAKIGEPFWSSPWGIGRPGWHIECSAMSMKYLGESFDIHGGGRDLIFPHHENEIAQSEAATGKPFARFWLHHGLVTINGQKMSKSLGNFITLEDVTQESRWGLEELKFLFLSSHYRMPMDYSHEKMRMQKSVRERFIFFFDEIKDIPKAAEGSKVRARLAEFDARFHEAMDDDFNTPEALAVMHELVNTARADNDTCFMVGAGKTLKNFFLLLGLSPDETVVRDLKIETLIEQRNAAKQAMDFKKADEIRDRLLREDGVTLIDTPKGTKWRKA